jgi:hypothetical protein
MSGPIVRKYGFPNFEKIFGEREVQHGVDDTTSAPDTPDPTPDNVAARKPSKKAQGKKKAKE